MFRFKKWLPCVAVLVGAAILGVPTLAHADFELRYSIDGGATFSAPITDSGNPGFISVRVDGLTIEATASGSLGASLSSLDLGISGQQQVGQNYDLVVQATVTGVPTAPSPQTLGWSFTSGTDLDGLTETAHGWVSTTNTAFDITTGIVANTGSLTAPASGSTSFSATPPYSWTEQYTLTGTSTGAAGTNISADDSQTITASAVPEPATIMTAFAAMPFLGLGAWLRRRKQAA
jgi:hypothetical protein